MLVDELHPSATPTIGLFLETLIKSVDGWLNNSIEVNLVLSSILSRLASHPHPLLRSLILNPYLILQPSIPGLVSSIATLKQRIDSALYANENTFLLIEEARSMLQSRLPCHIKSDCSSTTASKSISIRMIEKFTDFNVLSSCYYSSTLGSQKQQRSASRLVGLFNSMVRKDHTETFREETSSRLSESENR